MKKQVLILLSFAALTFLIVGCGQAGDKKAAEGKKGVVTEKAVDANQVVVYYFHSKQRCPTCLRIQEITEMTIREDFADNGNVIFEEVDYSEARNEKLADKYEIAMSSLIIAKGDTHENMSETAFANAMRNPEALKSAINETVNKYLNN